MSQGDNRGNKDANYSRSRLALSLKMRPKVMPKPTTKGQFRLASESTTCVRGLPTTGTAILDCEARRREAYKRLGCGEQAIAQTHALASKRSGAMLTYASLLVGALCGAPRPLD